MKRLPALAALAGCLCAAAAVADSCKFSAERSAAIDSGGPVRKVVLGTGAGDVIVRGEERAGVSASGRACASSQELLDGIQLEVRREGDTVYMKTVQPTPDDGIFWASRYAYLDLTVRLPRSAELSLEDSSGDLEVGSVRTASIVDSSGDQLIHDIAGDLDVIDSSGEIDADHIAGSVKLKDSSGDMELEDVKGDVEVTVDSSGEIEIEQVEGSVRILSDSSGDIRLSRIKRDVTIDIDTSGDINVDDVGGNFTVNTDGSGGISHERVLGAVRLPSR
jgi:Putative adhesin